MMQGDGTCNRCGKPTMHGRHLHGEACLDLASVLTRPQTYLRETRHAVHSRPEGIDPGKLEIVWRKR